ncbi:hypothetical protein NLG97_g2187 [Lecanicillium saksenae]|uniref:Uncharacterized protein n=1 Tax=Lecanicillium saksenae TaxID=468837 RepID=A0ACC1R3E3_9HYPO|nr:hypothetical protein NLG97_g2187 [Lecanicillium saksenae]
MFASFELWSGGMVHHAEKKKLPRSKTGCLPCKLILPRGTRKNNPALVWGRRNKKKCGEERPICRRCKQRGYKDCIWPESLSPSASSPKQGDANPDPTLLPRAQPSSVFLPRICESTGIPSEHAWQAICHANRAIHGAYFDDHYTIVVPFFPLVAEFPAYAYTWLALGAAQLAQHNPARDSYWRLMALNCHSKALCGLRKHLESSPEPQEWALCSTLLLHIFEKFGDEHRPPSDAHVISARGYFLRQFIQRPPTNMRHTLQLESLIYRVAVTSLFRTSDSLIQDYNFLDPFVETWETHSARGSLWQHSLWIGLQPPAFNAVFKLSNLLQCVPLSAPQMSEVDNIEHEMAKHLESHSILPSGWALVVQELEQERPPKMTLAEQSLTAHCIFGAAAWIVINKLRTPQITHDDEPVRELVHIACRFLKCIMQANFFSPVLIWPTIIIGLAASQPEDRTLAARYINRLADVSGPRASASVMGLFARAWGQDDTDYVPGLSLLFDSATLATVFI